MNMDEFKDKLFDVLNETNDIPIKDLEADDRNNDIRIFLDDGSTFQLHVGN